MRALSYAFLTPALLLPRPPLCVTAPSLKALLIAVLTCVRCSVKTTLPANVFRDLHVRSKLFPRAALGASSALSMSRESKLAVFKRLLKGNSDALE